MRIRLLISSFLVLLTLTALSPLASSETSAQADVWTTGGPDGVNAAALAIDPRDARVVYLGTYYSGAYKTTDGGQSWRKLDNGMVDHETVSSLAVSPQNPAYVLAGTEYGLYYSLDSGESWSKGSFASPTYSDAAYQEVVWDPDAEGTAYAFSERYQVLARTLDAGISWSPVLTNTVGASSFALDPTSPSTMYLGYEFVADSEQPAGLVKSTDGGLTWTSLGPGRQWLANDRVTVELIVVDPVEPNVLYLSVTTYWSPDDGLYKSTDGGVTWNLAGLGNLTARGPAAIAVDPQSHRTLYASRNWHLYKTTDGGLTWKMLRQLDWGARIALSPPQPSTLYIADYGLARSDNGGTAWNEGLIRGLRNLVVENVVSHPTANGRVYAFSPYYSSCEIVGPWQSDDSGSTWKSLSHWPRCGRTVGFFPGDPRIAYTIGSDTNGFQGFYRSSDGGATWTRQSDPVGSLQIVVHPFDPNVVYAVSSDDVRRSMNGGISWTPLEIPSSDIDEFVLNPHDPAIMYVSGHYYGTFRSTDGGATWESLRPGNQSWGCIALDPVNPDVIYLGRYGVYKSYDGGLTATLVNDSISPDFLRIDPSNPQVVYAAEHHTYRIARSADGGATWQDISPDGLPSDRWGDSVRTEAFELDSSGQTLYIGTSWNGVWTRKAVMPVLSGRITDGRGLGVGGVQVYAGPGVMAVTGQSGYYSFSSLPAGLYNLKPYKAGYTFSPSSAAVRVPTSREGPTFYAIESAGMVDRSAATLIADPLVVEANGQAESTITVRLLNVGGAAAAGERVTLVVDSGQAIVEQPALTDSSGETRGWVRSPVQGVITVSAWVAGVPVGSSVTITFGPSVPIPDALMHSARTSVQATNQALDSMWEDAQGITQELAYLQSAQSEYLLRLSLDFLNFYRNGYEAKVSMAGNVPAKLGLLGEDVLKGVKEWVSDDACQIIDATSGYLSKSMLGDGDLQTAARFALRYPLYLMAARQGNEECLRDLRQDYFIDAYKLGSLLSAQTASPAAISLIGRQLDQERQTQQAQLERLSRIRIPPLSEADLQAYQRDLGKRAATNVVFMDDVRDVRWTLDAVHQANSADPLGGESLQLGLRSLAKGGGSLLADGFGSALVSTALSGFDIYMHVNAYGDSVVYTGLADSALLHTVPRSIDSAVKNVSAGLGLIEQGVIPENPQGQIVGVRHVSRGSEKLFGWEEEQSFTEIDIKNTGRLEADFLIVGRYLAETARLGFPWASLWQNTRSPVVRIAPGDTATVRAFYRNVGFGYSPREEEWLGWGIGEKPASPVNLTLVAVDWTGMFWLANNSSPWEPARVSTSGASVSVAEAADLQALPVIADPITGLVSAAPDGTGKIGYLWVTNPYTSSVPITVTQPLVSNMAVLDLGYASLDGEILTWTDIVAPLSSRVYTYTFSIAGNPGTTLTLPAAGLELQTPDAGLFTDATEPQDSVVASPVSFAPQIAAWTAFGIAPTLSMTATNRSTVQVEGTLAISVTAVSGASIWNSSTPLNLAASGEQAVAVSLPPDLAFGTYAVSGAVSFGGPSLPAFHEMFSIGAPPPLLVASVAPVGADGSVRPESDLTFTAHVTNRATIPLTNVVVTSTLPAGAQLLPASITPSAQIVDGSLRWEMASLATGAEQVLSFTVHVPEDYLGQEQGRYIESAPSASAAECHATTGVAARVLVVNDVLANPGLMSPVNGASVPNDLDLTFQWSPSPGATEYQVEWWGGPYASRHPCGWSSATMCHIGQVAAANIYSWRVKARSATEESAWSPTWTFTAQPEAALGEATWVKAADMAVARSLHRATLLTSGKVLVVGGIRAEAFHPELAELYDPDKNSWTSAGNMTTGRNLPSITLLPSGAVLVAGGSWDSVEYYDPSADSWHGAGTMISSRGGHTATLLPSGRVLVTGGHDGSVTYLATSEIYDSKTDSWARAAPMAVARYLHSATLLPSGKVLVTGGFSDNGSDPTEASAELYDEQTDTWSLASPMSEARHRHTATLLASGKVLVTGGLNWTDAGATILSSAEIYDSETDTWSMVSGMTAGRSEHTATLLPSGNLMVAGQSGGSASAELYDPVTDLWSSAGSMTADRRFATATLLRSGQVLVAGGEGNNGDNLASCELYESVTANHPPNRPSRPVPAHNAVDIPFPITMSWTGGDPDPGDSVTYTVKIGWEPHLVLNTVCTDISITTCGPLQGGGPSADFYWQVVASDSSGATAIGDIWHFKTASEPVTKRVYLPLVMSLYAFHSSDMVSVPAGEFQMGCDPAHNDGYSCWSHELPLHTVFLDSYTIGRTEVTNAQYAQCVAAGGCTAPAQSSSATRSSYYDNPAYANYPVIYVSWHQADAYCRWAGKRLPTEAEWEKAARGASDTRAYPWGDATPNCLLANSDNHDTRRFCVGDTSAVGSYPAGASPYGALDMAGNVWEWVNDWYSSTYYSSSPPANPPGPASGDFRVLRGGHWSYYPIYLRVASRINAYPTDQGNSVGFRCGAASGG